LDLIGQDRLNRERRSRRSLPKRCSRKSRQIRIGGWLNYEKKSAEQRSHWNNADLGNYKKTGAQFILGSERFVGPKVLEATLPDGITQQLPGTNAIINTWTRALLDEDGIRNETISSAGAAMFQQVGAQNAEIIVSTSVKAGPALTSPSA